MIALAVDTAPEAASVAILEGGTPRFSITEPMARGHQERLAPLVREAFQSSNIRADAVDRVGVVVGPGSFTGVRVGLAFAKGFALALNIPCVGVSSLEAMALSREDADFCAVIIEGGRGEVYMQLFDRRRPQGPAAAIEVLDAERRLRALDRPLALVGSGALRFASLEGARLEERVFPDPVAIAVTTSAAPSPISPPAPLYLRRPDAKTRLERARP